MPRLPVWRFKAPWSSRHGDAPWIATAARALNDAQCRSSLPHAANRKRHTGFLYAVTTRGAAPGGVTAPLSCCDWAAVLSWRQQDSGCRTFPCMGRGEHFHARQRCGANALHAPLTAASPRTARRAARFRFRAFGAADTTRAKKKRRATARVPSRCATLPPPRRRDMPRPAFAGRLLPAGFCRPALAGGIFAPWTRCDADAARRHDAVRAAAAMFAQRMLFAPLLCCSRRKKALHVHIVRAGGRVRANAECCGQTAHHKWSKQPIASGHASGQTAAEWSKQQIASGQTAAEWSKTADRKWSNSVRVVKNRRSQVVKQRPSGQKQPIASGQTAAEWSKTADRIATASGLAFTSEIASQNRRSIRRSKSPVKIAGQNRRVKSAARARGPAPRVRRPTERWPAKRNIWSNKKEVVKQYGYKNSPTKRSN